jgi:hypothetical protein
MDITYIPMARGFVYLAVVLDWYSRRVLSWRLSITMEVDFCLEAVEEALAKYEARDFQHRSGQPIYQRRLHRPAAGQQHRHQHGGTTSSSSGCGAASNTRRSISAPTTASRSRAMQSCKQPLLWRQDTDRFLDNWPQVVAACCRWEASFQSQPSLNEPPHRHIVTATGRRST